MESNNQILKIAEQIIKLKKERKELNNQINELLNLTEKLGIPKKAMRLAINLIDKDCSEFDNGFIIARKAIGKPIQMELEFKEEYVE